MKAVRSFVWLDIPLSDGSTARAVQTEIKKNDPDWPTPLLDEEVKMPNDWLPILYTYLDIASNKEDSTHRLKFTDFNEWMNLYDYRLNTFEIETIRRTDRVFTEEIAKRRKQEGAT